MTVCARACVRVSLTLCSDMRVIRIDIHAHVHGLVSLPCAGVYAHAHTHAYTYTQTGIKTRMYEYYYHIMFEQYLHSRMTSILSFHSAVSRNLSLRSDVVSFVRQICTERLLVLMRIRMCVWTCVTHALPSPTYP